MTKKAAAALPSRVAAKVGSLCDLADAAFVEGRVMEAAERYVSAWKLLPEPREQWESGREIVKCVAEACLAARAVRGGTAPLTVNVALKRAHRRLVKAAGPVPASPGSTKSS